MDQVVTISVSSLWLSALTPALDCREPNCPPTQTTWLRSFTNASFGSKFSAHLFQPQNDFTQGTTENPSRVILVNSVLHHCCGTIDKDDTHLKKPGNYSSLRAYGQSKFAQVRVPATNLSQSDRLWIAVVEKMAASLFFFFPTDLNWGRVRPRSAREWACLQPRNFQLSFL